MTETFGPWFQIYVKDFKSGTLLTPEYAKRIDQQLNAQTASAFVAPDGVPICNDGEFEIRVFQESSLSFVKYILEEHYSLKIERVKRNEVRS